MIKRYSNFHVKNVSVLGGSEITLRQELVTASCGGRPAGRPADRLLKLLDINTSPLALLVSALWERHTERVSRDSTTSIGLWQIGRFVLTACKSPQCRWYPIAATTTLWGCVVVAAIMFFFSQLSRYEADAYVFICTYTFVNWRLPSAGLRCFAALCCLLRRRPDVVRMIII